MYFPVNNTWVNLERKENQPKNEMKTKFNQKKNN